MRKKDNRGMSLVELIIVIALMSVIAGVSGYGLSLISNKPVEECTKKVEMILNRNRTNSMGKNEAWVEFYIDEGLLTYQEHLIGGIDSTTEQVSEPVVIGAQGVNLAITYSGQGSEVLSEGKLYTVAFSRDSGAVKDHVDKDGEQHNGCKYSSCEHGVCIKIEIFKGTDSTTGNKTTIVLDRLTGKVTIE